LKAILKSLNKSFFVFFFLLVCVSLFSVANAQNKKNWEIFTDYKDVNDAAVLDNKYAFCATSGGLFVLDLTNGNIVNKYSTLNGLLYNELYTVAVDNNKKIWLGASDGSIVIFDYYNERWSYIYDIRNSNESSKSINSFVVYGNYIFAATSYGIHKISTVNFNFVDAPYVTLGNISNKTKVNKVSILNNFIFAATASGIAYAYLINTNLNNPATWTTYVTSPMSANVRSLEPFDNKMFAGSESGFMYFDSLGWTPYPNTTVSNTFIRSIKSIGNKIYFISNSYSTWGTIYFADKSNLSNITQFLNSGSFNTISSDNTNLIIGSTEGGVNIKLGNDYVNKYPNCPNRNSFNHVSSDIDGNVWGASGQIDGGFYKYNGSTWTNYNTSTFPLIGGSNWFLKVVPGNGVTFAMGFGGGVTKLQGSDIFNYNTQNSNLPGIGADSFFCASVHGAFDKDGRFWALFYSNNSGASMYAYNNSQAWYPFYNPPILGGGAVTNVAVDNYNTKWVASFSPPGLYYFNENGTISNPSDDIYGFYTATGDFAVNTVTDVVVDKNNAVWIATDYGVFIIDNPLQAVQDPNNKPAPAKLGIISGNLKVPFTENCKCIFSDILSEKWIGTQSNGVFHLSLDGTTLIEQFNMKNSPLPSNEINAISVNQKTGKAYFATLKGLSSLQTSAIEPVENFDKIICSPNPYLIPSSVEVKIDGLVEESKVKIITLSGEVVIEFDSPGGRIAKWNGYNTKGELVPSGIYIIVAYNKDATKVGKGKLAIVRR
jgi:ligand-binding sensor domain-containing protein